MSCSAQGPAGTEGSAKCFSTNFKCFSKPFRISGDPKTGSVLALPHQDTEEEDAEEEDFSFLGFLAFSFVFGLARFSRCLGSSESWNNSIMLELAVVPELADPGF